MSEKPDWAGDEHTAAYDPRDPNPEWEIEWMAREIGSSIMTPEELLKQTALKSNGRAGEEAAAYAFKRMGWTMFKAEPPVKNCGPVPGRPGLFKAVYAKGGMPDFIGYCEDPDKFALNNFRVCEVKEATPTEGDSVPHSRLSAEQRDFMAALPSSTAYVGILWRDGAFEVFNYCGDRGSYKKGEGLKYQ